nr:XRE family transcriptional regulator [Micromonospora sp. DSM 115978]
MAVHPVDGVEVRLTGAAGVELRPLEPGEVVEYLRAAAGGPQAVASWEPVLQAVEQDPTSAVAQALTTPLAVTLARAIYNPRPGEHSGALPRHAALLYTDRFPARRAVEHHLFAGLVRAVYRA